MTLKRALFFCRRNGDRKLRQFYALQIESSGISGLKSLLADGRLMCAAGAPTRSGLTLRDVMVTNEKELPFPFAPSSFLPLPSLPLSGRRQNDNVSLDFARRSCRTPLILRPDNPPEVTLFHHLSLKAVGTVVKMVFKASCGSAIPSGCASFLRRNFGTHGCWWQNWVESAIPLVSVRPCPIPRVGCSLSDRRYTALSFVNPDDHPVNFKCSLASFLLLKKAILRNGKTAGIFARVSWTLSYQRGCSNLSGIEGFHFNTPR